MSNIQTMFTKIKSWIKLITINLILFLILLFVTNKICQVVLNNQREASRALLPNYADDQARAFEIFKDYASVKHQYQSFEGWRMLPYKGETLHINAEGYRIQETNSTGSKNIWFFGGSTMWGEGSDDDHTIPAIFSRLNPEYKSHNFGQLAYNSRQGLEKLISLLTTDHKVETVVFYDGLNDAAFLCPSDITQLPGHRLAPMFNHKIYASDKLLLMDILKKHFYVNIVTLIKNYNTPKFPPYNCLSNPEKADQIANQFVRNWELAHELTVANGGQFYGILQPNAFTGNPDISYLILDPVLGGNIKDIYARIKVILQAKNYPWVYDLSEIFNAEDRHVFIDFCHVSANGNEKIASIISSKIVEAQKD